MNNCESIRAEAARIIERSINEGEIAGANLLILKDGKELFSAECGYADLASGLPIQKDTIFRLYSMSKPITSAAVMILVERGLIDLYDPVEKFLPGFRSQTVMENGRPVPVNRKMTVRDLMNMTSGLLYSGPGPANAPEAGAAAEEVIGEIISRMDTDHPLKTVEIANMFGSRPLAFHPGSHFNYGTSADILGALVEVISGKRFGTFLKEEIFEPLGMSDTAFFVPKEKQSRLARTYEPSPEGIREFPCNHLGIFYRMEKDPAFESGGAGLASTLPDYSRFASMLLNEGTLDGVRIMKPATVRFMTSGSLMPWQQIDLEKSWDNLTGYSYGNLLRVQKNGSQNGGLTTAGEYGWDGWLGPYFSNYPTEKLTILMGMQKRDAGTWSLTRRLRNLILSSL